MKITLGGVHDDCDLLANDIDEDKGSDHDDCNKLQGALLIGK